MDTTVDMLFQIYEAPSSGNWIFREVHSNVRVSNSLFHVLPGETSPFGWRQFDMPDTLWLGITVGGNSEMTHRAGLRRT